MRTSDFFEALDEISESKRIPKETIITAVKQALVAAYKKKLGLERNIAVEIDEHDFQVRVFMILEVVEDGVEYDPENAIPYSEAVEEYSTDLRVGDQIQLEKFPEDVGRIAAQTVKQVVIQKIREAERKLLFGEFSERIGQLMNGTVHRIEPRSMLVDLGKTEAVLPYNAQIPRQNFKVGDQIKVCISDVEMTTKGPIIKVSRANTDFLKGLFRYYIPEIQEGIVKIKNVVREAGVRSKISVYCDDIRIDPVGACVGMRGARIKDIVAELSGEKIDIIKWDENIFKYIENSLSPAEIVSITMKESEGECLVVVPQNHLSLAIGKEGQNVRLAAKLTNYKIDIKSEAQYREEIDAAFKSSSETIEDNEEVLEEKVETLSDENIVEETAIAENSNDEFKEPEVVNEEVLTETSEA